MDKRKHTRVKRRIQLRFWSREDPTPRQGFSHNISVSGMFIGSSSPFKPGTRIFVEIPTAQEKLVLQAEVRYSARVDPLLQKVKPSGMGVRFLSVEEVMTEVLRMRQAAAGETQGTPTKDVKESVPELRGPTLRVDFETPHQVTTAYERDIKYGGLFVPAVERRDEHDEVVVEFRFAWDPSRVVRLQATVIRWFEAAEGTAAGEAVSGAGVAFVDPGEAAVRFGEVVSALGEGRGSD